MTTETAYKVETTRGRAVHTITGTDVDISMSGAAIFSTVDPLTGSRQVEAVYAAGEWSRVLNAGIQDA